MKRQLSRVALAIVLSAMLAAVAALPAAADAPTRVLYPPSDETITDLCSFPIHYASVKDHQTIAIRPGPDGAVAYHVSGQWQATLTNLQTGYSLAVNEGPYSYTVYPDGSVSAQVMGGHYLVPGYNDLTHGRQTLSYAPGWVLIAWHLSGRSESLCAALDP